MKFSHFLLTSLTALALGTNKLTAQQPQKPMTLKQASKGANSPLAFIPTLDQWSVELSTKDGAPVLHISDSCATQTDYTDDDLWTPDVIAQDGAREYYWQGYIWNDADLAVASPVKRDLTYTLKDGKMIIDVVHHDYTANRTDSVQFVMRNVDGTPKNDFFFTPVEVESATANGWGYEGSIFTEEDEIGWSYGNKPGEIVYNLFGTIMEQATNTLTHVLNIRANAKHHEALPAEAVRILYGSTQERAFQLPKKGRPDAFLATLTPHHLAVDANHIKLSWDCTNARAKNGHTECDLSYEDGNIVIQSTYSKDGKTPKQKQAVYRPTKPYPGSFNATSDERLIEFLSSCEMVEGDGDDNLVDVIDALQVEHNCRSFTINPN